MACFVSAVRSCAAVIVVSPSCSCGDRPRQLRQAQTRRCLVYAPPVDAPVATRSARRPRRTARATAASTTPPPPGTRSGGRRRRRRVRRRGGRRHVHVTRPARRRRAHDATAFLAAIACAGAAEGDAVARRRRLLFTARSATRTSIRRRCSTRGRRECTSCPSRSIADAVRPRRQVRARARRRRVRGALDREQPRTVEPPASRTTPPLPAHAAGRRCSTQQQRERWPSACGGQRAPLPTGGAGGVTAAVRRRAGRSRVPSVGLGSSSSGAAIDDLDTAALGLRSRRRRALLLRRRSRAATQRPDADSPASGRRATARATPSATSSVAGPTGWRELLATRRPGRARVRRSTSSPTARAAWWPGWRSPTWPATHPDALRRAGRRRHARHARTDGADLATAVAGLADRQPAGEPVLAVHRRQPARCRSRRRPRPCAQLAPGSDLLAELDGTPPPTGVRVVSIAARGDLVVPARRAPARRRHAT